MNDTKPLLPATVNVPVKVEIDCFVDWIVTAIEGGISYWSDRFEYKPDALYLEMEGKRIMGIDGPTYADFEFWERHGELQLIDCEPPFEAFENNVTIPRVLEALPKLHPEIIDRLMTGQYDADDVDLLIQYALFGEVVFG